MSSALVYEEGNNSALPACVSLLQGRGAVNAPPQRTNVYPAARLAQNEGRSTMIRAPKAPQQRVHLQLPGRRIAVRAGADQKETGKGSGKGGLPEDDVDEGLIGAVGTWVLWAGLLAYTFYIAPNQVSTA